MFQIGSAIKLPFATQINPAPDVAAVWKLSDTVDDDIETIDSNNLLDEEDLQKPDPSKLKGACYLNTESDNVPLHKSSVNATF